MIRSLLVPLLSCIVIARAAAAETSTPNEASEGQALAAELRSSFPEENSEVTGVLKIRSQRLKLTNNIPVVAKVAVYSNHWESIYQTAPAGKTPAEILVVRHFRDKPNEYLYAQAPGPTGTLKEPEPLSPDKTDMPLANSDFSLADLGLDFLHWPIQRRLKDDRRLDRSCYVLESAKPAGDKTISIKSSIDKESNGILIAEAFDASGNEIKQFTLSGTSFRKVDGRWQLQRMEIHDRRRHSTTVLEFDPPPRTK